MNLEVLIPFLLLPAALTKESSAPVAPALERLLSRSTRRSMALPNEHAAIFERLGVSAPYPHAPLLALGDGLPAETDAWMFAEPVHLEAGHNGIALFPAAYLDVTPPEAASLVSTLNQHFARDGIAFQLGFDGRWYVRHPTGETPLTHSVEAARSGALAALLPRSKGKLNWASIQNEAQMVLYGHAVNRDRETAGRPTINGIWFWGGGELPRGIARPPGIDLLVSSSPLVQQLASCSGIALHDVEPHELFSGKLVGAKHVLLVFDTLERHAQNLDVAGWTNAVQQLDATWFQPLLAALAAGHIGHLRVRAPAWELEHDFTLSRRQHAFGFWRRTRPITTYA